MDQAKIIRLECIFCSSTNFELPYKGYAPTENEHIKCANCGKINIFSDIKNIAVEHEINEIAKDIKKQFKNIFK